MEMLIVVAIIAILIALKPKPRTRLSILGGALFANLAVIKAPISVNTTHAKKLSQFKKTVLSKEPFFF